MLLIQKLPIKICPDSEFCGWSNKVLYWKIVLAPLEMLPDSEVSELLQFGLTRFHSRIISSCKGLHRWIGRVPRRCRRPCRCPIPPHQPSSTSSHTRCTAPASSPSTTSGAVNPARRAKSSGPSQKVGQGHLYIVCPGGAFSFDHTH